MITKIGKKRLCIVIVAIILVAIAVGGALIYRRMNGNKKTAIAPKNDMACDYVVYYRQADEQWAEDKIGTSDNTMKSSGCLICCIASALKMQSIAAGEDSDDYTPKKLNDIFTKNNVYDSNGNIVWDKIKDVLSNTCVEVPKKVDNELIDTWLGKGYYPLVRVKNHGDGAMHWVLITGAESGEYMCMDPLVKEDKTVKLSEHGGSVYSCRCVYVNN